MSIIRARAALVRTTSFSASYSAITLSLRTRWHDSIRRAAIRCSFRSARSNSGYSSSMVMEVRNPRPPRFTAKIGISRPRDGARSREKRSVPAEHNH